MKKWKRMLSVLLALALMLSGLSLYGIEAQAASSGDFIYTVNADGSVAITGYGGSGGDITIPSEINGKSVTSILGFAFSRCDNLTKVSIPTSVTSIGVRAFSGCSSLTEISIPASVTNISYDAFINCSSLAAITVEEGNTVYDSRDNCNGIIMTERNMLLLGCKNTVIPASVTIIAGQAFSGCSSLTEISIPASVTNIGSEAFYNCSSLTEINIPASVTRISNTTFYGCSSLAAITVEEGNTVYDSRDDCNGIIETESNTLFYGCNNTTIPSSVVSIGDSAFQDCFSLTEVTIPSGVTSIGKKAFSGCSSLTEINLPDSVTSISNNAFFNCSSLTEINLPDSVTSLSDNAFIGCIGVESIMVGKGNTVYDSRDNCNAVIETESNTLLLGCNNTSIPASVTGIGRLAFYGCSGLKEVTIPSGVTSIGSQAFSGCSGLEGIAVAEGNTMYSSRDNCNAIIETESNMLFLGCKNTKIPDGVASIGDYAFYGSSLAEIRIPSSVMSIGYRAFSDCSSLSGITIPSNVTVIKYGAFIGCSSLTEIIIPSSVTSMGDCVFQDCSSLASVSISSGVESVGNAAFSGCISLTEVLIPDSMKKIENEAFYGCISLTEVSIPGSVKDIQVSAFSGCSSLASVSILSGVELIQDEAFRDCISLTEVSIPGSVRGIGSKVFYGCSSLANVSILSGVKSVGRSAFSGCGLAEVSIPGSVVSIGESAFGYSMTREVETAIPGFVVYGESDSEAQTYANENGFTFQAVSENDIRWADVALSQTDYIYDGQAKKPSVTVTLSGKELSVDTDYTVSYSDNTNAGQAKATVSGTGNYSGTVEKTYTISAADITVADVALSPTGYIYDGTEKKPTVTVTLSGKTLVPDTDYTVSYSDNTAVGTAKATVNGTGNYTGTVEKPYTIGKAVVTAEAVTLSPTGYIYDGTEKKPTVTVTLSGKTLVLDTDYTVSYSNNTNAGTATATVTAIGNYTGNKAVNFAIVEATENPGENTNSSITCKKTVYKVAYGSKPFKINATSKSKLTFTSSSSKIAAVDKNTGMVTIKGTGVATITVKAGNNSVKVTVKVRPKKATLKKVKAAKGKKLTVKWAKDKKASGYQVQISTSKNFKKNVKKKNVKKTSYTFKKLKVGKKYYVRVRSYKKSGKKKLYGAWSSKKKSSKVKK